MKNSGLKDPTPLPEEEYTTQGSGEPTPPSAELPTWLAEVGTEVPEKSLVPYGEESLDQFELDSLNLPAINTPLLNFLSSSTQLLKSFLPS